jgi:hypothetical protein
MLSISHSVTGAFIATHLPNPLLYVPLIFAAHYLEDWIPHWDVGTGLSNGTRNKHTAMKLELIDLALTAILIFLFWQYGRTTLNMNAWMGAGVALIPDFLEAPRNFLKSEPGPIKPMNKIHGFFHHSTPNVWLGLLPQIVVVAAVFLLR